MSWTGGMCGCGHGCSPGCGRRARAARTLGPGPACPMRNSTSPLDGWSWNMVQSTRWDEEQPLLSSRLLFNASFLPQKDCKGIKIPCRDELYCLGSWNLSMVEPRDLCISRIWEEFCIMETTVNQGSGEQGLSQALGPSSFGFFQKTRGFLPLGKHKTGAGVGLVLWDSPSYPSVMVPPQEHSLPTSSSPAHFGFFLVFYFILEYGWGLPRWFWG